MRQTDIFSKSKEKHSDSMHILGSRVLSPLHRPPPVMNEEDVDGSNKIWLLQHDGGDEDRHHHHNGDNSQKIAKRGQTPAAGRNATLLVVKANRNTHAHTTSSLQAKQRTAVVREKK